MANYKAPLRDIQFVRNELLELGPFYTSTERWSEVSDDLVNAITGEAAKFSENTLAPLNSIGDEQGCSLKEGKVTTPEGFKEAYQQFVAGGWPSLEGPAEFGGQALPKSLALAVTEMIGSANWAWGMYTGLSQGACHTINEHGTAEQKERYLHKLVAGEWTGTMCLTESHCGSDLGLLRCKAEPNTDGSYHISGTKIFISSGEHDLADNIIHIVLARLPDAPAGTKGISLFIVPKFKVNEDGSIGERNQVSCGALEHKMGIHGNATCVMNFDGATGYLLGPENRGLNCMFTFMNVARVGTAIQGLAHAELAYQNSLAYATDRLQMRALSGPVAPDKPADPIIVHPDVRRMLLTQKAFAEGGRMMIYQLSQIIDLLDITEPGDTKQGYEDLLSMLTPIAKAFMTETGFEAANHGMQIFGGHGYIREWGMEQNVRDSRISMLYEGTTGIQALDLLGRKVMLSRGELLKTVIVPIHQFCKENSGDKALAEFIQPLQVLLGEWSKLTEQLGAKAMGNPDEINAACVDYLMYSGYVYYAYLFAKAAKISQAQLAENTDEQAFYQAKVYLAQFYYQRLLPRTATLATTMLSGVENLLNAKVNPF
ncbi:MAG: acyl-CoA dehydrogenase C-terminal domain-containing protein [Spongiibacteraceae bacterium]